MKKFNRLKDLNTESIENFYTQVKNAVDFAKNNAPMSSEEECKLLGSFEIMQGSKNPLTEKEKVIAIAEEYGFIDSTDFVTVIQNDDHSGLFLKG